jgi:hypothetical protein
VSPSPEAFTDHWELRLPLSPLKLLSFLLLSRKNFHLMCLYSTCAFLCCSPAPHWNANYTGRVWCSTSGPMLTAWLSEGYEFMHRRPDLQQSPVLSKS